MACTDPYIPTWWVNNTTPAINALNLNHLEQGVKDVTEGCIENSKMAVVPIGGIIMFNGDTIPARFSLCDGTNGTPDLTDKFIRGALDLNNIGDTGGTAEATMPEHSHTADHGHTGHASSTGSHSHPYGRTGGSQVAVERNCGNPVSINAASHRDTGSGGGHSHSVTINSTSVITSTEGTNGSEDNLPPYYILAFIMRTV